MVKGKNTVNGVVREARRNLGQLVQNVKDDLEILMGRGPTAEVLACLKLARLLEAEARGLRELVDKVADKYSVRG